MITKVLQVGGVVFVIYFLVTNPVGAAGFVHGLLIWLQHAAGSLSSFASHI